MVKSKKVRLFLTVVLCVMYTLSFSAFAGDTSDAGLQAPVLHSTKDYIIGYDGSITLNWSPVEGATGYKIIYYTDYSTYEDEEPIYTGNVTTYTLTNRPNDLWHYINVIALKDDVESLPSNMAYGMAVSPITPPENLDWYTKTAPALPEPSGNVVRVSSVAELEAAVSNAVPNQTIVIANGTYQLTSRINIRQEGLTIRGESNDRSKVVLLGDGFEKERKDISSASEMFTVWAPNVTIANLTLKDASVHGIAFKGESETTPHGLHVYNVAIYDIGQRYIKGTAYPGGKGGYIESGVIEYCHFEQTRKIKPFRDDIADGDYVGGFDAMNLKDWIVRDNVFINIRGAMSGGRGAVFVWINSMGTIVERNVFIGNDRSIAFGNPYVPDHVTHHHTGGIIRNNFIYSRSYTMGIELCATKDVKVYNNTIVNENPDYPLAVKCAHERTEGLEIKNNLVRGLISSCPYQPAEAVVEKNLTQVPWMWFEDPSNGNLKLTHEGFVGIRRMEDTPNFRPPEVKDDFFGNPRKGRYELGAHQLTGLPHNKWKD